MVLTGRAVDQPWVQVLVQGVGRNGSGPFPHPFLYRETTNSSLTLLRPNCPALGKEGKEILQAINQSHKSTRSTRSIVPSIYFLDRHLKIFKATLQFCKERYESREPYLACIKPWVQPLQNINHYHPFLVQSILSAHQKDTDKQEALGPFALVGSSPSTQEFFTDCPQSEKKIRLKNEIRLCILNDGNLERGLY